MLALVSALVLAALPQQPERGAYIVSLGRDTMAIDRYEISGNRLTGSLMLRSPAIALLSYTIDLDAQRRATRLQITTLRADNSQPVSPRRSWDITFGADSLTAVRTIGDSVTTTRLPVSLGAVPLLHVSMASVGFALAVQDGLRKRGDSVAVSTYSPGSRAPFNTYIKRDGTSRALFGYVAGARIVAWVGANGRVDSLDHGETTVKLMSRRVADADVAAIARSLATREASGDRLGSVSPRDTVRARIGGADVTVEYGRPAARGRAIFGGLVPYGDVWRTGADAATHLTISSDLEIDGVRLPAGRYTIFTRPQADSAVLMVNGQTNQWGTVYDPARDVRHFTLRRVPLTSPAERFTIRVDEDSGRGVLRLDWDRTRYEVAFAVR